MSDFDKSMADAREAFAASSNRIEQWADESYDTDSLVVSFVAPESGHVSFGYDASGRLRAYDESGSDVTVDREDHTKHEGPKS